MAFFTANCNQFPATIQQSTGPAVQVAAPLCFNLRGNSGRNIMNGPGVTNLDFSVFKNNQIKRLSENFNVQFRVEMFNILNHPNFAPPGPGDGNTDIFGADGSSLSPTASNPGLAGVLIKTTTPERQIQFAVKVIF